jgi:hypothetical protein
MYDLVNVESMNLVDWYDSLDEALDSVRQTIELQGPETVATWALVPENVNERPLKGEVLVKRALESTEELECDDYNQDDVSECVVRDT